MLKTAELDIYGKGLCHIDLKKKKNKTKKNNIKQMEHFYFSPEMSVVLAS